MATTRAEHFRLQLGGRLATYGSLFALAAGLAVAAANHDPLGGMTAALAVLIALMVVIWKHASEEWTTELFRGLAPALGLQYMVTGSLPPITPLLGAGDRRTFEHYMEGPVFGSLGGPRCGVAHYAFRSVDEDGKEGERYPFTVCGMEIDGALPLFHGVFLRPRGGIVHDWLRGPRTEAVELESTDFAERYELRAAADQDRLVLHELFSPSFQVRLLEHPLRLGFECKAGELVVFIPGHELDRDRLILFHEAARDVARHVCAAIASPRAPTPAA